MYSDKKCRSPSDHENLKKKVRRITQIFCAPVTHPHPSAIYIQIWDYSHHARVISHNLD